MRKTIISVWRWYTTSFLHGFIYSGLVFFIGSLFTCLQTAKDYPYTPLRQIEAAAKSHPSIFFVSVGLLFFHPVWVGIHKALDRYVEPHLRLNRTGLSYLLNAIDDVVGRKHERFTDHVVRAKTQTLAPGDIFMGITQPLVQMKELIESLQALMALLQNDRDLQIKVILAEMGPKHVSSFLCCAPVGYKPIHEASAFNKPQSTFSRAKERKKLVIVSDIEAQRKVPTGKRNYLFLDGGDDTGSIMSYPIHYCNEIPMVLSIYIPKRGDLMEVDRVKWNNVLERFEKRLVIEYSLLVLKRHVEAEGGRNGSG